MATAQNGDVPTGAVKVSLLVQTWSSKTVVLRLLKARGLPAADANGFSAPYAVLELVDATGKPLKRPRKHRTVTVKKTLAPVWNEEVLRPPPQRAHARPSAKENLHARRKVARLFS